ncbi:MAG TPA: histidine kinase [Thermoleophilaceae bacterium]|nr:histidine kinase [Thermoleophilaceae bacterium]
MDPVRRSKTLAWSLGALIAALVLAVLMLVAGAGERHEFWGDALAVVAVFTTTGVGLAITARQPGNRIGWLLMLNGLLLVLSGLAEGWAAYSAEHPGALPGERLAAVWDTNGWPLLFAAIVALAFVFPDGRLPSRRWRPAVALAVVAFSCTLLGGLLSGDRLDEPFEHVRPLDVLPGATSGALQGLGLLGMVIAFVLALSALVVRFRRAEGEQRTQIKWIAWAGAFIPLSIVLGTLDPSDAPGIATFVGLVLVEIAIPGAIGVAILRYRLYDIDRLISATLVYAVLTVCLGTSFAAVALVLGIVLGGGSVAATAAATLAVTLAFRPLRDRVQRLVDRRFDRLRYEANRQVDAFLAELREGRAQPEAVGAVLAVAVSDPSLRVFFWLPSEGQHGDDAGHPVPVLPAEPAGRTPVRRGELHLATIVHLPQASGPSPLLDDLIVRAGLAIEIARLRVEVRHQLAEVEASRSRIVSAGLEERRRLERDLHDGAQQRLISLGLELRHAQHELGAGEASATLDSVVAGLTDAITELRELASGVRPAALDDGLAPALEELAARAPIRTEVTATSERFSADLEAAAYFVASEGLTNAVKHAGGSQVRLQARRSDGRLVLRVEDDGRGGAAPGGGSGLVGLADRVAALGGELDLQSSEGRGTALVAEFPCGQ